MIPNFVRPYLWSYDISALDLKQHKKTIIFQILNLGSKKATDWLFSSYDKEEIKKIANTVPQTQWNKKSLRLWSVVLGIAPSKRRLFFSR